MLTFLQLAFIIYWTTISYNIFDYELSFYYSWCTPHIKKSDQINLNKLWQAQDIFKFPLTWIMSKVGMFHLLACFGLIDMTRKNDKKWQLRLSKKLNWVKWKRRKTCFRGKFKNTLPENCIKLDSETFSYSSWNIQNSYFFHYDSDWTTRRGRLGWS